MKLHLEVKDATMVERIAFSRRLLKDEEFGRWNAKLSRKKQKIFQFVIYIAPEIM